MTKNEKRYPKEISLDGGALTLRLMTADDEAMMLEFAGSLPTHDLLYVRRDITNPKVVSAWARAIAGGTIATVLAQDVMQDGGAIAGCAALIRDPLSWSPHLGELRVLVSPSARQKGLGRILIQECFVMALEQNLEKLIAHMTVDQKGAIAIFEELGFRGEALLKDHVKNRGGETHDIVILSCDIDRIHSQISAYGIDEAL